MAKQLAAHKPPIPVAAVDATVSKAIASRYAVTGYPTVFAFRGTTPVHYDDEKKNAKDMVQYPLCTMHILHTHGQFTCKFYRGETLHLHLYYAEQVHAR